MFPIKRSSVILVVFVLLTALLIWRTFTSQSGKSSSIAVSLQTEQTKRYIAAVTRSYQADLNTVTAKNDSLSASLSGTKNALSAVRQQAVVLQRQVLDLLAEIPSDPQSANVPNGCDSLRHSVTAWLMSDRQKDSLYEMALTVSDSLVKGKDSIISLATTQNDFLGRELDTALVKQEQLVEDNLYFQRQFQKQKKKKWLFACTSSLLTAVGIFFLHH